MSIRNQLVQIAKQDSIKVHFYRTLGNWNGQYDPKDHSIYISVGKRNKRDILYTLAHELGHAYYRHGNIFYSDNIVAYNNILLEEIDAWNYATKLAKRFKFYTNTFIKHRNRTLGVAKIVLKEVYLDK